MAKELRILILEDVATDAELMERELSKAGIAFVSKLVETEEGFIKGLLDFAPDLILSDYSLPSYDGMSALARAQEHRPEVPFIFVSGAIGEETAIKALKNGATDYVLKERLSRIGPVVDRALQEMKLRAERERAAEELKESEKKYRNLFDDAVDMIHIVNKDGVIIDANPAELKALNHTKEEHIGKPLLEIIHPDYRKDTEAALKEVLNSGEKIKTYETVYLKKNGSYLEKVPFIYII